MSEECLSTSSSCSGGQQIKRKIELCRAFVETGYCRYGIFCYFAHGVQQLVISQPVLRSKVCRNFHRDCHCRFGDRCNFKHEANILLITLPLSLEEYPQIITMGVFRKRNFGYQQ